MLSTEMNVPNVAKFVYHFEKEKDLASMNAGFAVPNTTTDILNAMELLISLADSLAQSEEDINPLYRAMKDNENENKKLEESRESPKKGSCLKNRMSLIEKYSYADKW